MTNPTIIFAVVAVSREEGETKTWIAYASTDFMAAHKAQTDLTKRANEAREEYREWWLDGPQQPKNNPSMGFPNPAYNDWAKERAKWAEGNPRPDDPEANEYRLQSIPLGVHGQWAKVKKEDST